MTCKTFKYLKTPWVQQVEITIGSQLSINRPGHVPHYIGTAEITTQESLMGLME